MSVELLGLNIDDYSFDGAIDKAKALIDGQKVAQVITINPEMCNQAEKDSNFANIIKEAELVIPDGVGIKIGLKLLGHNVQRIPGIDFAKRLLLEASTNNIPVAIVGAQENVISKAIVNLQKEIDGLNIVYYRNGYFNNSEDVYNELKTKAPKLVLVALGSPKQEEFIYMAKKILNPCLMVGIGGSLDVWSGTLRRAPKIIRILGFEWLYRTFCQPSRFKRIFPTIPLFLIKVIKSKTNL